MDWEPGEEKDVLIDLAAAWAAALRLRGISKMVKRLAMFLAVHAIEVRAVLLACIRRPNISPIASRVGRVYHVTPVSQSWIT